MVARAADGKRDAKATGQDHALQHLSAAEADTRLATINSNIKGFDELKQAVEKVTTAGGEDERKAGVNAATRETIPGDAQLPAGPERPQPGGPTDFGEVMRNAPSRAEQGGRRRSAARLAAGGQSKTQVAAGVDPRDTVKSFTWNCGTLDWRGLWPVSDLMKELDEKVKLPDYIAGLPWLAGNEDRIKNSGVPRMTRGDRAEKADRSAGFRGDRDRGRTALNGARGPGRCAARGGPTSCPAGGASGSDRGPHEGRAD